MADRPVPPGAFAVISIMREPLARTLRFAAWYLEQGARRLLIYLDDPQDPALPYLEAHPRCLVVRCTPAFWAKAGIPTDIRFSKRQNLVMTRAYHRVKAGWVLNVDADELVLVQGGIGPMLAAQPAETEAVRILPAEIVRPDVPQADLCFRLPMRLGVMRRVYGEDAIYHSRKRLGLAGHSVGKSATRAGLSDLALRQHWGVTPDGGRPAEVELGPDQGAYVLHMIEEGYADWSRKVPWRLSSRGFAPNLADRIAEAQAAPDPDLALRRIYSALHEVDEGRLGRMADEGVLMRLSLDFKALVAHHFGAEAAEYA